jgi:restriction endonuclease S subunit
MKVTVKSLSDLVDQGVVELTRGKIISKKDIAACPGEYPVYSSAKEGDGRFGEYGRYMFDEELITWSVDGGGRLFHRPKHRFSVTNVGGVLRILQPATLDYRFLYHALTLRHSETMFDWVRKAHPSVIKKLYVDIPVPPLAEQQRIVALLDEAFAGLATAQAHAERNLRNARALFESHLNAVFTQRGEGWVEKQLASVCSDITVGHVGSMKAEYKERGIPFLRSQNIRPFEVSMENAMFIDKSFHSALKKSQLRPGDLAIVRTGYPGTAAVIPPDLPDSNCSDLVIVRPSEQVNPHFLAAFFNSSFGKLLVLGKTVGAAQKHFNITAAKAVMLYVPPIGEQSAIVEKIEDLRLETQRLTRLYERKLTALAALKQSLLHQAFSGAL